MILSNDDMKKARDIVRRLGARQWGWQWKDPKYVDSLTDEQVIGNLILLAEVVDQYNQIYCSKIDKAIEILDWKEYMGK